MKHVTRFLTFTLVLALSACSTCPFAPKPPSNGQIEHVVLVWLKRPGNAADRATLVSCTQKFQAEISQIQYLSAGPALPSERPIVDDSFDIGFVMRFTNKAALDAYEKHPMHQKTVKETLLPLAKKIQVYDIQHE